MKLDTHREPSESKPRCMNKRLLAFLVIFLGVWQCFGATQVMFKSQDWGGSVQTRPIKLTPQYQYTTDGTNIYYGVPVTIQWTNSNGIVTNALNPNNYTVTASGINGNFVLGVPFTNVVVDAITLTSNLMVFTNWVNGGGGGGISVARGTNIFIVTNGSVVTISSTINTNAFNTNAVLLVATNNAIPKINGIGTNTFVYSGTNTFGPSVTNYSAVTNFYITSVSWNTNLGGLYEWQSTETGGDDGPIYFASNGTYGLIANLEGQGDYPHFYTVTNGAGATIAFCDSPPTFPNRAAMTTNAVLSDAYISFATNSSYSGGWSFIGPVNANLGGGSNLPSSGIVWGGRPQFDGILITNLLPPANWGAALVQTPQFGWNSYLQTSCTVNENEVLAVGTTWATNGVLAAGPCWIWIDCGWASSTVTNINANFPNGVTNVINTLHNYLVNNNRFKVGIYFSANGLPFNPPITVSSISNEVQKVISWGVDGIKIDGLLADPNQQIETHAYGARMMAQAILNTRSNVLLNMTLHPASVSEMGAQFIPKEFFNDTPMWETTSLQEVGSGVNHDLSTADTLRPILWATQRGRIGQFLFNNEQGGGGTENGMTNALNMNLLWPSWIHVGWTNATATKYWTNSELRQILSDGFVAHNREVYSNSYTRIWARPLGSYWPGNKYLVGFINGMTTGAATSNLTVTAGMLGWPTNTPMLIHDPYRQADTNTLTDSFTVTVTTNQTTLYVISLASLGASTNAQTTTVDMRIKRGDLQTTGVLTFAGIKNKSATDYQTAVIHVFNTGGTASGIVAPPNTYTNGTLPYLVTNYSVVNITYHPLYGWTNMLVIPIR
jgi:hypothetical protein